MTRLKLTLIMVIVAMISLFSAPVWALDCSKCSATANLSSQEAIECGSSCASGNNSQTPKDASTHLNNTIKTVINVISAIAGVLGVIMIIIAGFRYITSGGKQESITAAKNTILYAVIGLVIVALAQIIVRFVLHEATSGTTPPSGNTSSQVSPGALNSQH